MTHDPKKHDEKKHVEPHKHAEKADEPAKQMTCPTCGGTYPASQGECKADTCVRVATDTKKAPRRRSNGESS